MKNKLKYCPDCGRKTNEDSNFCKDCGYKLTITQDIVDEEGQETRITEIIESETPIEVPDSLILLPGEKLLTKHISFYASNKRIILHEKGLIKTKTHDLNYKHISGSKEEISRPFLTAGLIIGLLLVLMGFISIIFVFIGAVFVIIAFWFKKTELVIKGVDGTILIIPNMKSETGKKLSHVVRTQLYGK